MVGLQIKDIIGMQAAGVGKLWSGALMASIFVPSYLGKTEDNMTGQAGLLLHALAFPKADEFSAVLDDDDRYKAVVVWLENMKVGLFPAIELISGQTLASPELRIAPAPALGMRRSGP